MKRFLSFAVSASVALASACLPAAASAAAYPDKPISLVVVFGAGGTSDVVARIVGKPLGEALKQQVVVENRPGASGNIGATAVARAAPDGYTLLAAFPGLTTNAALYDKLNYNPAADFAPISLLASAPNVIVVNQALPVTTLAELIDYARARPGKLNFGSAGAGASSHLAGEALNDLAGLSMTHVPYKGGAPALTDLAGGQLDVMVIPLPEVINFIRSGRLKAVALASAQRSPLLPEVPTTREAGLPDFEVGSWYGLSAPAATPPQVLDALEAATIRALDTPEVVAAFEAQGIERIGSTRAEFAEFLRRETERWSAVIQKNNIKLQ